MKLSKITLALSALSIVTACGGGGSSDGGSNSVDHSIELNTESVAALQLGNTRWRSECILVENSHPTDATASTYQQSDVLIYEGSDSYDIETHLFELPNSSCSDTGGFYQEGFYHAAFYVFVIGDPVTTSSGLPAYEVSETLVEETTGGVWDKGGDTLIYRDGNTLYWGKDTEDNSEIDFSSSLTLIETK